MEAKLSGNASSLVSTFGNQTRASVATKAAVLQNNPITIPSESR